MSTGIRKAVRPDGPTHRNAPDLLDRLITVGRRLFLGPFELDEVLATIVEAGCSELRADRGSVLLFDPQRNELYSRATSGNEEFRFAADKGIAGACVRLQRVIRVDDCYADPRFNRDVDRRTGYRSRSLIAVPLVGLEDEVVGVMQLLNPEKGSFDAGDEVLAEMFGGFAAVAIQRARYCGERLRRAKLEEDLELAREIQMNLLPETLPVCPGYDLAVFSRPAEETGGDIYDLFEVGSGDGRRPLLLLFLADATGHGIGAALCATQVRAMLGMAVRVGVDLDALALHLNNQLVADLPANKLITAFVGELDPERHVLEYHALGHGPILHFHAASGTCHRLSASTLPIGFRESTALERPQALGLEPGDIVGLFSDGFFEYDNPAGQELGSQEVGRVMAAHADQGATEILAAVRRRLEEFAEGAPQEDDLTAIIVKRV